MSSQPTVACRACPLAVLALAAVVVAGCTGGPAPTPAVTPVVPAAAGGAGPSAVPATVPPTAAPSPSGVPAQTAAAPATPGSIPAGPPVARLVAAGGEATEGALGSYTWGQEGSDSPWILPRARDAAAGAGPWIILLEPALAAATWRATWAPVRDGAAGTVAGWAEGEGGIAFDGPRGAGPWSLRVEAAFGDTGSATWYWRLAR